MPDILSPSELADLRNTIRDLTMNGTAHVLRGTLTPDGLGGWTQTRGTVYNGGTLAHMPVRYRPETGEEISQYGRIEGAVSWRAVAPVEWGVTEGDQLVIIENPVRVLRVHHVISPVKPVLLQLTTRCTEITTYTPQAATPYMPPAGGAIRPGMWTGVRAGPTYSRAYGTTST